MTAPLKPRLYGIPNCDTVKKARAFLAEHGVDHEFIDFKKSGAGEGDLQKWAGAVGWEKLVNRQGTTWRKLAPAVQSEVVDADSAVRLMHEQTSVIKRPVVEWPNGDITLGFSPGEWKTRVST